MHIPYALYKKFYLINTIKKSLIMNTFQMKSYYHTYPLFDVSFNFKGVNMRKR